MQRSILVIGDIAQAMQQIGKNLKAISEFQNRSRNAFGN